MKYKKNNSVDTWLFVMIKLDIYLHKDRKQITSFINKWRQTHITSGDNKYVRFKTLLQLKIFIQNSLGCN